MIRTYENFYKMKLLILLVEIECNILEIIAKFKAQIKTILTIVIRDH